jgi:D-alanine-D-alanine ligase-like ATP-grasp enzyme
LNLEAFCCIGLTLLPQQLDSSLSLLPESEQQQAREILQNIRQLPKPVLLQRWSKLRSEEFAAMSRDLCEVYGLDLDRLPPSLHPWCTSWWAEQHG